jgi:hypothetical protein
MNAYILQKLTGPDPGEPSDLTKRLILLMIRAGIDSDEYDVSIGREEVIPYVEQLQAEGTF